MNGSIYTRVELLAVADEVPQCGPLCPKCKTHIPQFADLAEEDERRVRYLIGQGRSIMAIQELRVATGCPLSWAKIWVSHGGSSCSYALALPAPCPFCGKPLRTSLAKQCRFCRRDWHDPENMRFFGDK